MRFQAVLPETLHQELESVRESLGLPPRHAADLLRELIRMSGWLLRQNAAGRRVEAHGADGRVLWEPPAALPPSPASSPPHSPPHQTPAVQATPAAQLDTDGPEALPAVLPVLQLTAEETIRLMELLSTPSESNSPTLERLRARLRTKPQPPPVRWPKDTKAHSSRRSRRTGP